LTWTWLSVSRGRSELVGLRSFCDCVIGDLDKMMTFVSVCGNVSYRGCGLDSKSAFLCPLTGNGSAGIGGNGDRSKQVSVSTVRCVISDKKDENKSATSNVKDVLNKKVIKTRKKEENIKYYSPYVGGENFSRYQMYPQNALLMGARNFRNELSAIGGELVNGIKSIVVKKEDRNVLPEALKLSLCNKTVNETEKTRENQFGQKASVILPTRWIYESLCLLLDIWFDQRPIERFWFLETVARVPYFAYTSVLHLYETLGWWRSTELISLHQLETANEFVHLMVMESLGGNRKWRDRFLAEHMSILYYWVLVIFYFISPKQSYAFSELLEGHAVDTYSVFLKSNEERLKQLPPVDAAVQYYSGSLCFSDSEPTEDDEEESSVAKVRKSVIPKFSFEEISEVNLEGFFVEPTTREVSSLYDVFQNINADEWQHVRAMKACQKLSDGDFGGFNPVNNEIIISSSNKKPNKKD